MNRIGWCGSVIVVALIIIYLATLTSDYYWDGITFALQIEKVVKDDRRPALLFHQNHLLYNALGYLLYCAAQALGSSIRAINLLQIANAFAGALAVGVFYGMAERATRSRYVAIVCSAALAVSAAWWKISTDADAYVLAMLLILVCASNLLGAKPRWFIAGLALAGAMLIHQLASLFYPVALVAIYLNKNIERKTRFAACMSALAWGIIIPAYYLLAALLHGITRPLDVLKWVTSNPSQKPLSSSPVGGILAFPRSNLDAIIGHNFALFSQHGGWFELTVVLAAIITALTFALIVVRKVGFARIVKTLRQWSPEIIEARKQIAPVLIVWVGAYVLFLLFWGPLIYFRAFYTPALALGAGLVLSNFHLVTGRWPSGAAALAVAALALFNLSFYIGLNMRADSNVLVTAARNASNVWNDRAVIYFIDRNEADTAFEYFNDQTVWRKFALRDGLDLDSEIDRITGQGGSIWLNKGAAESVDPKQLIKYARGIEIEVASPHGAARYVQLLPQP